MLIVYDSFTGNVQRFIDKLGDCKSQKIVPSLVVDEPYVLITYTIGFGEVPESVQEFLEWNYSHLRGVASSGNRIWGDNYTMAATKISKQYNVPVLHRFELSGTKEDVNVFQQEVINIDY